MKKTFKIESFCAMAAALWLQDASALELTQTEILGRKSPVNFNALVQGWAIGEASTNFHGGGADSAYRLRRAELKLTSTIGESNRWFVMADASKAIKTRISASNADTNPLQEFGLGVGIIRGLELVVGQYKPPTMAEALEASSGLLLPERSLSGRTFGYRRELGAMLAYRSRFINVMSMVSTGRSVTVDSSPRLYDLHNRIEVMPLKNLIAGAFVTLGEFGYSQKGRAGLNAKYSIGQGTAKVEYAQGKTGQIRSNGAMAEVSYKVSESLEPAVRAEVFTADLNKSVVSKAQTIGVNYYFRQYNSKLQIAASALQNMAPNDGTPTASAGNHGKSVTLSVQSTI